MLQHLAWLNQVALLKGIINLWKEDLKKGGGGASFAHDHLVITRKHKKRIAEVKNKTRRYVWY